VYGAVILLGEKERIYQWEGASNKERVARIEMGPKEVELWRRWHKREWV